MGVMEDRKVLLGKSRSGAVKMIWIYGISLNYIFTKMPFFVKAKIHLYKNAAFCKNGGFINFISYF